VFAADPHHISSSESGSGYKCIEGCFIAKYLLSESFIHALGPSAFNITTFISGPLPLLLIWAVKTAFRSFAKGVLRWATVWVSKTAFANDTVWTRVHLTSMRRRLGILLRFMAQCWNPESSPTSKNSKSGSRKSAVFYLDPSSEKGILLYCTPSGTRKSRD